MSVKEKDLFVILHETTFWEDESYSVGGYIFEKLEDAEKSLLDKEYVKIDEDTFTKKEDGLSDVAVIVQTLLKPTINKEEN